ncbi:MAG: protease [Verrucomicrobiota bacterium]
MVFSLVLLALLAMCVLVIFSQFARSITHLGSASSSRTRTHVAGPRLEEVILEDNDASSKIIAVVDVTGIISSRPIDQGGFTMVDLIKAQLKNAAEDKRVKSVILKVDSPGGEVLASDEISEIIKDFQNGAKGSRGKPVIVSMGNLAASGGYYISAPCRWIVANKLTITGSIGVIMHGYNYRGLMDKIGLAPEVYKSGKFKDMLSGSRKPEEIPPEERAMVQALINEVYGQFKTVVSDGRKDALAAGWEEYADGRVLSGTEAKKLGFVDQLGNFDDAVTQAKKLGNIVGDANLIQYQQRYDLGDFLRMFGETKSESRTLKVDLGIETPKLINGQLYFLSPLSIP